MKTKTMNNTIEKWEKGFDKAVEKQWNTGNPYFPNWEGVKGGIRKLLSQAREEVYKNVGGWYKVPIRKDVKYEMGKELLGVRKGGGCEVCSGKLVTIRGKYPRDKKRKVCPTCATEIIEQILDNCNNRVACSTLASEEKEET